MGTHGYLVDVVVVNSKVRSVLELESLDGGGGDGEGGDGGDGREERGRGRGHIINTPLVSPCSTSRPA